MADNQFKNDLEEFSYSLGLTISSNLLQSGVQNIDSQQFLFGVQDIFAGNKPKINSEKAQQILQKYMTSQNEEEARKNLEEGLIFLYQNLKNKEVTETESGLQYIVLKKGYGEYPSDTDEVKCHYHGTLISGIVFDSSVERQQPAIFPVNGVIKGWTEALMMMSTGSKWRLFIPSELAYGHEGAGGLIGPNATLIFDVELLEIV